MTLRNRVAAITGASSGIGLACAEHLAREGVAVVLGARRGDLLDAAVEQIRRSGGRAEALAMDVSVEEDAARLTAAALDVFGRLDIMICNAGFGYYGTVEETSPAVMRRMLDVNFMGTFYGARAALPIFRRQKHGHLILMSSIVGIRGIGFMSGYTATKAAQAGFAQSLRSEFAGSEIHVTAVFPISTETGFRSAMARDYGQSVSGLGPKQSADDVARAILRCIRHPRPEVHPHAASRVLPLLNVFAPRLTDRFLRRYSRRRPASAF